MHEKLANLVEVVTALIDRLESKQIPYAFGGAIALSAWSDPRATTDVDLTIWAHGDDLATALDVLREAGVVIDSATALGEAAERGLVVGHVDAYRIDVFTPSIPFYDEVLVRRRRVRLADRDTWVLSAECLAVFKMLFFRGKDLVDLTRLVDVMDAALDRGFVRRWLVEIVGDDDPRVREWDRMTARPST